MKYKVGDKVRIKSIDWYNENKDKVGNILYKRDGSVYPVFFSKYMSNFCGEILTIKSVFNHSYHMNETSSCEFWTDEMIECKVEEEMKRVDELLDDYEELTDRAFKGGYEKCKSDIELNGFQLPDGYIFKDENGNEILTSKIILEKKKKEVTYPKTYEECCEIFQYNKNLKVYPPFNADIPNYDALHLFDLLEALRKLLICRDAYWKIAGEEMGLSGSWKPDFASCKIKYAITYYNNVVSRYSEVDYNSTILVFPTEEMRDAFYENFKKLIESCKELL